MNSMFNKSKDSFETSKNIFINKSSDNNFFLSEDKFQVDISKIKIDRPRRLNDYDFNLLREDAYKDVSDDLFKLEYKISKIEEEIAYLSCQIQSAKEINDADLLDELLKQRELVKEDYESLTALYNEKSLSARVSDSLSNIFSDKIKNSYHKLQNKLNIISNKIVSKLPERFSSILELKTSLNKLENINRSVDELISMNIPYGENINKYEQLSKYIIKANEIQGQLSKYIKK